VCYNEGMNIRTLTAASVLLTACQTTLINPQVNANGSSPQAATVSSPQAATTQDDIKFFIYGKRTSSLSSDKRTITLSVDAKEPSGKTLKIEWENDDSLGTLNATRGSSVQWTVNRDGNYTANLKVSVSNGVSTDTAYFGIPVAGGKIAAPEIAPEISVAPQLVYLFKPLPSELNMSDTEQSALGVRTAQQLVATTYIYDALTNTKVKKSGDFNETIWTSSDPSLVTVSDNGYIRSADGSATGSTIVNALSKTNSSSRGATQVLVDYLTTEITLGFPTTTLYSGGSLNKMRITASVDYSNPADRGRIIYTDTSGKGLVWRSSNSAMAQVDPNGNVTVLADAKAGEVNITARSKYDPSISASLALKVVNPAPVDIEVR